MFGAVFLTRYKMTVIPSAPQTTPNSLSSLLQNTHPYIAAALVSHFFYSELQLYLKTGRAKLTAFIPRYTFMYLKPTNVAS